MKNIVILIIIIVSIMVLSSVYSNLPKEEKQDYINVEQYNVLAEKYNHLLGLYFIYLNKSIDLDFTNKELIETINQMELDNRAMKYSIYVLNKESYYPYYPTGCDDPKRTFTACENGCDSKIICSKSMRPLFSCYNKLTFAECSKYSVGDIVVTKHNEHTILHQIVDIDKDGLIITKGFNNEYIDGFNSTYFDIMGKVIKIEY